VIAILLGSLIGESLQSKKISEFLTRLGHENVLIDFHKLSKHDLSISESEHGLTASFLGRKISPKTIYIANNIRTDAIVAIPEHIIYPNSYRFSLSQMLLDFRHAFTEAIWLPGKNENIERGDSKPYVFSLARRLGLSVPVFTENSFFPPEGNFDVCKKPLGFPFRLSINKDTCEEVGLTGIVEFDKKKMIFDGYPWQWQTLIRAKLQIRCFCVGKKIWSVAWEKEEISDFRYLNQVKREDVCWKAYSLPNEIVDKLLLLMSRLDLQMSAPEFLVDQDGKHTFIDLNPCGDWYGFFPDNIQEEITQAIVATLISAL